MLWADPFATALNGKALATSLGLRPEFGSTARSPSRKRADPPAERRVKELVSRLTRDEAAPPPPLGLATIADAHAPHAKDKNKTPAIGRRRIRSLLPRVIAAQAQTLGATHTDHRRRAALSPYIGNRVPGLELTKHPSRPNVDRQGAQGPTGCGPARPVWCRQPLRPSWVRVRTLGASSAVGSR